MVAFRILACAGMIFRSDGKCAHDYKRLFPYLCLFLEALRSGYRARDLALNG